MQRKKNWRTKRYYFSIATIGLEDGMLFVCHAHTMGSLLAQQSYVAHTTCTPHTNAHNIVLYLRFCAKKRSGCRPKETKKEEKAEAEEEVLVHATCIHIKCGKNSRQCKENLCWNSFHYFGIFLAFAHSLFSKFYIEIYCLCAEMVFGFPFTFLHSFYQMGWWLRKLHRTLSG